MKKLTYLFLIIGIMNSCDALPDKRDPLIISKSEVKIVSSSIVGKYVYTIYVKNSVGDIILYSDSLYSIGDTLKLVKQ